MKNQIEHPLKAIRRAGVPLVAYETSDPAQTILSCVKALNSKAETSPVVVWDIMNGQRGMNEAATGAVAAMGDKPLREWLKLKVPRRWSYDEAVRKNNKTSEANLAALRQPTTPASNQAANPLQGSRVVALIGWARRRFDL